MKIKKLFIAGVIMLATTVAGVISSGTAWAANNNFNDDVDSVRITKTINEPSNPVRTTFDYSVSSQTPNAPSIQPAQIVFNGEAISDDDPYAKYTTISFDATYPDVGEYVYTITESNHDNNATYPADSTQYKVYVTVHYVVGNNDVPDNDEYMIYVIAKKVEGANENKVNDNSLEYATTPVYAQVTIDAGVHGNMAKKNKCFPYKVLVPVDGSIVSSGDAFDISISNTDNPNAIACSGNPQSIPAGSTGTTIYLKHGDVLTFTAPIGTTYSVARGIDLEDSDAHTNYTMTIDGGDLDTRSGMNQSQEYDTNEYGANLVARESTHQDYNDDNFVHIIRTYDLPAPAGIFLNVWTWIILAVIAIISIIIIFKKTNKKKEQHLIAE